MVSRGTGCYSWVSLTLLSRNIKILDWGELSANCNLQTGFEGKGKSSSLNIPLWKKNLYTVELIFLTNLTSAWIRNNYLTIYSVAMFNV